MSFLKKIINKGNRVSREILSLSPIGSLVVGQIPQNFILMYHGVSKVKNTTFNKRHVSKSDFERQLKFLTKYTHIISVKDYFDGKFIKGKPNCSITFDDGYLNNYLYAKPILEQYKCPATFYITGLNQVGDEILWADFLNLASKLFQKNIWIDGEEFENINGIYYSKSSGDSLYDIIKLKKPSYEYKKEMFMAFKNMPSFLENIQLHDYWKLMSNENIIYTSNSKYVSIGSHGFFHNNLGSIGQEAALVELNNSKNYLENLTQKEINELAYPDGSYSENLRDLGYDIGFKYQLSTESFLFDSDNETPYIKTRLGIYCVDSSLNQILSLIK